METSTLIILGLFFLLSVLLILLFLKIIFKNLALKTLQENQKSFLDLAEDKFNQLRSNNQTDLETKKEAIEKQLNHLNKELETFKTNTTELKTNAPLENKSFHRQYDEQPKQCFIQPSTWTMGGTTSRRLIETLWLKEVQLISKHPKVVIVQTLASICPKRSA